MEAKFKISDNAIPKTDLEAEITARYDIVKAHYEKWDEIAKEDYQFALGEQWTEEERTILKDQKRPALTFNRIRPLVNLVSGYQRENSSRIKANPEGGEDRIFSEVVDRGIKHVDKRAHLTYKEGYWFDDGCYCGKGFLEAIIDYDKDPIRGELRFKQRSPYQILADPECVEYDINEGARYLFKIVRLPKSTLKDLYPGKAKLIEGFVQDQDDRIMNGAGVMKEGSDDDYGNSPNVTTVTQHMAGDPVSKQLEPDQKFTVREYWRPKKVTKYYVINLADGEPERFDTKEEAEEFVTKQNFGKVIDRNVSEMWVAAYCCGFVLDDQKSLFEPYYHGFPFFRFMADWAPNADTEDQRVQGIARPLKDPQREKNKAKSQYLHILNTQANSGWVGDDDALTKTGWKLLEKMGAVPGITIKKKKGSELREIQPKGPNLGHVQREQMADEEFKQISGINPDLMGFQEGTASGRAISMRMKQGVLAMSRLFHNFRYSKEIIGVFILEMMPMLFDSKKFIKILGSDFMNQQQSEKYPYGLTEGIIEGFLTMIKDHKYDVYVTEAAQNATIRFETFQELTELVKAGVPIPPDLIIDYMDIPDSENVKKKIGEAQAAAAAAAQAKK